MIVDNIYFGDSKRDGASQGANYGAPSYGAGSYGAAAGGNAGGYGTPSSAAPSEFAEIDDVDGELPF